MINAYAARKRPRGWSFLAHYWELIIVSLGNGKLLPKRKGSAFSGTPFLIADTALSSSLLPYQAPPGCGIFFSFIAVMRR
jgi:hypothetical protein